MTRHDFICHLWQNQPLSFCFSRYGRFFYRGSARLPQIATFWYYQIFLCRKNPTFSLFCFPLQGRTGETSPNSKEQVAGNKVISKTYYLNLTPFYLLFDKLSLEGLTLFRFYAGIYSIFNCVYNANFGLYSVGFINKYEIWGMIWQN